MSRGGQEQCPWTGRPEWWFSFSKRGTGECTRTKFMPGYWKGGSDRWSNLRFKSSSLPSQEYSRGPGSLPNQSTCTLWTWRRLSTRSLEDCCGGCCGSMGFRSLYACSRSCVRIIGIKSDTFPVDVGLRQGCPSSPVLFVIFMYRISRPSLGVEHVRFGSLGIASLLFADDVVLLASSDRGLRHSLGHFAAECEAAGMSQHHQI